MNHFLIAAAPLTLALLATPLQDAGLETCELSWRLPEGARYRIVSELSTTTETTTSGQLQEQSHDTTTVRLLEVDTVDEEGVMHVTITLESYRMLQESDAQTISLDAKRGEDGQVVVDVEIESRNAMMEGEDIRGFFEQLGANMLEIEFGLSVTPLGIVLESAIEGDPLEGLPDDTEMLRMIWRTMKIMLDPDDLSRMVAAELFVQLPAEAVGVSDDWQVERSLAITGLEILGKGTCTFDEFQKADGRSVAALTEHMDYELGTSVFEERMTEMMTSAYKQVGLDVDLSMDFEDSEFEAVSKSTFGIDAGHNLSTTWTDMRIPFHGALHLGDNKVEMQTELTLDGTFTWSRIER